MRFWKDRVRARVMRTMHGDSALVDQSKKPRRGMTWREMESIQGKMAIMRERNMRYADAVGIDYYDLVGTTRKMPIADIRAAAMYAMRHYGMTLVDTANALGRCNHSTVIQAVNKCKGLKETDEEMRSYIKKAIQSYA